MQVGLILKASLFAAKAHRKQQRKGTGEPYVNHLIEVAELVVRIGGAEDPHVVAAALLHDVVEDTDVSADELEIEFGRKVRKLVVALSDDKRLPKAERKRLQIEHMLSAESDARLIKLADHCSNVADLPAIWPKERRAQYLDWSEQVAAACRGASPALELEHQRRVERMRAVLAGA